MMGRFAWWLVLCAVFYVLLTLVNRSRLVPWLLGRWCEWAHATEHMRAWSGGRLCVRCAKCQRESAGVNVGPEVIN